MPNSIIGIIEYSNKGIDFHSSRIYNSTMNMHWQTFKANLKSQNKQHVSFIVDHSIVVKFKSGAYRFGFTVHENKTVSCCHIM